MANINRLANGVISHVCSSLSHTKLAKSAAELAAEARELEMIPKVLSLQTVKKGTGNLAQTVDRFTKEEISEITKLFKGLDTDMSKYDLMKELINIGEAQGKPLSFQHISDFLGSTSSMSEKQIKNILKYIKSAAEDVETVQREASRYVRRYSPLDYISSRHPEFVDIVSKAKDPATLAQVVKETGVNQVVSCAADALTDVCSLSGNNVVLAKDLTKAFYPSEVKEIASKLTEKLKAGKLKDLSKYTSHTYEAHQASVGMTPNLRAQRKYILKALDLTGEIKLLPLSIKEQDPMINPRAKIIYGFERGKRR